MFTSAAAPECAAAFRFVSSSLSHCCSPGQNTADDKKKHTEEGRKQNETIRYPQKSEQEVLQHMLKGRKSPAEHCSARYQESHRAQKQNADTVSNPHKQPGDHRTQASQKECPEEKNRRGEKVIKGDQSLCRWKRGGEKQLCFGKQADYADTDQCRTEVRKQAGEEIFSSRALEGQHHGEFRNA